MNIHKSQGLTQTEALLSSLCDQTFLKLWSYANPYKDDGNELCDLIAIFENHVFIFFDRETSSFNNANKDVLLAWERWKKKVIDKQIVSANGAEKYIKSNKPIYLDSKRTTPLPLGVLSSDCNIHKIIVAHGASDACKNFSDENINGSLMISYGDPRDDFPFPFAVYLDKTNPIHVFDSYNLSIVLKELDTFYDFISYVIAKERAIKGMEMLSYAGEEELLAYYFKHFDEENNMHFILDKYATYNCLNIGQGFWKQFCESDQYKHKKEEDKVSYFWDRLIQQTCQHAFDGTLITDQDFFRGPSAIYEMAKEPRFIRRALSKHILEAIKCFPEEVSAITRFVSFMPSFYKEKGYVFLQLYKRNISNYSEYRLVRQNMLEVACGATKNKYPHLNKVIGIAVDAPRHRKENSEDFILLNCEEWTDENKKRYEEYNKNMGFYSHPSLKMTQIRIQNFPD